MVFKVEQGTSNDGYIPQNPFDMSIAAADHAMWEANRDQMNGKNGWGIWKNI